MSFAEALKDKLKKLTERFRVVERLKIYEVMKAQGLSLEAIWKSKQKQIEFGKLLKADYFVVGSVNIEGLADEPKRKLSTTIHTLNIQTEQVKEATVSGQMQELFDLEEQLALTFLMQMGISLTKEEEQLLSTTETTSLLAEKHKRIAQMEEIEKIYQVRTAANEVATREDKLPVAIITGLDGNVSFQQSKDKNWKKAMLNLPLYEGDKVKAQEASQATLWLRNGFPVVIKPKETVTVTTPKDKQRAPLFNTLWGALTRKVRRSHNKEHFDVTLAIRGETEADGINTLSPRNTSLLIAPKTFQWTEAPGAMEYILTIGYFTGMDKIWQTKVNGTSPDSLYPAKRDFSLQNATVPRFVLGRTYLWEVEAYDKEARLIASDAAWFRILTEGESDAIGDSIELIRRSAPDDKMTERLLLAAFYEQNELYLEAERLLKKALGENDHKSLHLMLADLYLVLGLTKQSRQEFQKAGEIPADMNW